LLLSKVTWLKFQVNFKQRTEKPSIIIEHLHEIEHKLRNHHHHPPSNRQQFHENKHQMKSIADDIHILDMQIQDKFLPNCLTPLSAGSSGYGSDMH
jgi:hypothetical protein